MVRPLGRRHPNSRFRRPVLLCGRRRYTLTMRLGGLTERAAPRPHSRVRCARHQVLRRARGHAFDGSRIHPCCGHRAGYFTGEGRHNQRRRTEQQGEKDCLSIIGTHRAGLTFKSGTQASVRACRDNNACQADSSQSFEKSSRNAPTGRRKFGGALGMG